MRFWFAAFILSGLICSMASADPRPFTFNYDGYAIGKGQAEYEQWVSWRNRTEDDHGYNRIDFRHEIEYGLTDKLDIAVYFATWRYEDSAADGTHTDYDSSSVELIYYLTNPVVDPLGIALYGEVGSNFDNEYEVEAKLILHKDYKNWTFVYNLILETEVAREDGQSDTEGVFGHSLGASQALNERWAIGAELLAEWELAEWSDREETTVYAGPNVRYVSGGPWWITATAMTQLTNEDEAADFYVRMIFGWEF